MLLGEPPRTQFDLNFSLLGVSVRVHPLFWLVGLLLGPRRADPPAILIWIAAFFIGILCHELGHAMVMRGQGCFSRITLYGLGGITSGDQPRGFGGKNPDAWRQIFISAAGPLAGFLLAAVVVVLVTAAGHKVQYQLGGPLGLYVFTNEVIGSLRLSAFVNYLLFVTVAYGILNLLPVYPLDGGQIARELLVMLLGRDGVRQSLILSMFVAGSLAILGAFIWQSLFLAIFFAYFAYASFAALQANKYF